MKTAIIIPARMTSQRFPNKPMALINGVPMVQRVWNQAILSNLGSVVVACCEKQVFDLITSIGGEAIMTSPELPSGTDRIFEVINDYPEGHQFDSIINLQGDMPIIDPEDIKKVNIPLQQGFDIGTLVTNISLEEELDINITKAKIDWITKNTLGEATDFYKLSKKQISNIYHHVGIYSFRYETLKKFVTLKPSSNELHHNLEQLRALDNEHHINVALAETSPIGVDTKEDYLAIKKIMEYKIYF